MYVIRKLKSDNNFTGLLVPFGILLGGAFFGAFFGLEAGMWFFAVCVWVYALYSFFTYVRTKNTGFVVVTLYQVTLGLVLVTFPMSLHRKLPILLFFLALAIFLLVWMIILAAAKRLKWRGREVLELAAAPVDETGNGYTPRPLPAGKTEFTQRQIMAFAGFALKNMIAVPYVGKDRVVFVPVVSGREFGFILGLKGDYTDETWVAFDSEGNVSVNISHRDYLSYQEALAFAQLCESLGNLFVEFIEMFHRGEGERIINRMNAVGIPYYS